MTRATAAVPSGINMVDPRWLTGVLRAGETIPDSAIRESFVTLVNLFG